MVTLKLLHSAPHAVACCLLLTVGRADAAPAAPVHVWQRWEAALTSTKPYTNPYADVDLQVAFTGPKGRTLRSLGFWDGGQTFKLRCAFPQAGRWSWRTTCSDAGNDGLHNQTGSVEVGPYAGDNPLYRHGFLKISANRRHLAHADDTPFLWIGDTAWLAYVRATGAEWDRYVEHRAGRGFSALMTSVSVAGGRPADARDTEGNAPFSDGNARQWNPVFWRNLEAKVQSANHRGLIMVLTGVGFGRMGNAAPRDVLAFARGLAARLAGNAVLYSPRQDWGVGHEEMLEEIGEEIHRAAPFALVTQHPRRLVGGGAVAPMPDQVLRHYYHLKSVDFAGVQTGPGVVPDHAPIALEEASRATLEWITALYHEKRHKPVVNLEGVYDDDFAHNAPGIATEMVRRGAYLSFLSGACGFTSSSYGLWMWGKGPPYGMFGPPPSVASAMDRPYATHLQHLAQLLSSTEWWRLEPGPDLILNQPSDWAGRMVLAKTPCHECAVAYLPNNPEIVLDLKPFPRELIGHWFNPRSGEQTKTNRAFASQTSETFTRPGPGDWVLLLRQRR